MSDCPGIVQKWQDNFNDELYKDEDERTFFGRDDVKVKLHRFFLKSERRIIQVYGLKEIGKSRVVLYALRELNSEDGYYVGYQNFRDRPTCRFKKEIFDLSEEPDDAPYREHLSYVQKQLNTKGKYVVLFLDNVDKLIEDGEQKELLQDFVRKTYKTCRNVFVLFSTTNQVQFTEKGFASMEVPAMDFADSMQLFLEVIEEKPTPEDEIYIRAIVTLLAGVPKAVMLSGCELREGIFKASEILELLISHLSEMLSREEYPADDRVGDTMRKVSSHTGEHEHALNSRMTGSEFTTSQSLAASSDQTESEAVHKLRKLMPLVRKCIVGTTKLATEQTFTFNTILQEYIALKNKDEESRKRINREKAKSIGLDTCGRDISEQRILAEQILKMADQWTKTGADDEEERSDDSGTGNDLDSGEETNDLSLSTTQSNVDNPEIPSDEFGRLSVNPADGHGILRQRTGTGDSMDSACGPETSGDGNVRRSLESTPSSLSGPPALQFESMGRRDLPSNVSYNNNSNYDGSGYADGGPRIVYCDDESQDHETSEGSLRMRGTGGDGKGYNIHADTTGIQVNGGSIEDNKLNNTNACGSDSPGSARVEVAAEEKKINGSPRGPPARRYSPPLSRSGSPTDTANGTAVSKLTRQPSEHDSNLGENLNTGEEKNLLRNKSVEECT